MPNLAAPLIFTGVSSRGSGLPTLYWSNEFDRGLFVELDLRRVCRELAVGQLAVGRLMQHRAVFGDAFGRRHVH
jgi:hypothetical protein